MRDDFGWQGMAAAERSKRRPGAATGPESEADVTEPLAPGLYLLATPIGNARDLTLRGLEALERADALACEDTRVLRKLLEIHGIALRGRRIIAYHDQNAESARPKLMELLEQGASIVYASDAGTPLIADPGYRLAREARSVGARVTTLPGASAVLAALCLSGLPTDRFSFGGFLPPKQGARLTALESWKTAPGSLVFFESPRRLADSLVDMASALGDRPAAVARELTKMFEEVREGSLSELAAAYAEGAPPKGEIVVVIGPAPPKAADEDAIDAMLTTLLETETVKTAARTVAEHLGVPKKLVYDRAVAIHHGMKGKPT